MGTLKPEGDSGEKNYSSMLYLEGEVFSVSILETGLGKRTGISAFGIVQFTLLNLVQVLSPHWA